jgi:subtilisin family serine protease
MTLHGRFAATIAIGLVGLSGAGYAEAPQQLPKLGLRGALTEALAAARADEWVPISVVLREQVDLTTIERLGAQVSGRTRIMARLKSLATNSQAALRRDLGSMEAAGQVRRIRPAWLSNLMGLEAKPEVIQRLADHPDVAWVNHNPKRPVFTGSGDGGFDWGVTRMRAPEVWSELNITGRGVKVAVIDSGVCYDHPDIRAQIWINPGEDLDNDRVVMDVSDQNGVDDDGNGFIDDLIGWDFDEGEFDPRDTSSGHGSHCAGTVAGDGTSGTTTGMAPDAQIMAVRVGLNLSDEVDVWNAMAYAAENNADVISMSLGWAHSWDPDRATWRRNCDTTIAMGTIMIVAAGNEGAGNEPDNVRTPGDVPNVITIGATAEDESAAGFSSRGPVSWTGVTGFNDHPYPPGLIKPDVSAPGNNTESMNFCSGYTFLSGTSMATPHVAGTAALMLEADPALSRGELLAILQQTSLERGDPGLDNVFGAGRVDAFAATNEANRYLRYQSHRFGDQGVDRGNGDLALDTNETAELFVTIQNTHDTLLASSIAAYLVSETPGVEVLDNRALYPDLSPGQLAEPVGGGFALRVTGPCFTDATLRLDLYDATGRRSRNRFVVRVGSPVVTVLFDDDGEADQGWSVSGSVSDGAWVRAVPLGTRQGPFDANPPIDASGDGTRCFVTGNSGSTATDDDVDGGETILTSPRFDASAYDTLSLSYMRWYYRDGYPSAPPAEWLVIEASDDDGASWVQLEQVLARSTPWSGFATTLDDRIEMTAQLRLRARAQDLPGAGDGVVEAALDEVVMMGDRIVCEPYQPDPLSLPPAVGNSLQLTRSGSHIKLAWIAPVPGPGQGPVTSYAIETKTTVQGTLVAIGGATRPEWWHLDAVSEGESLRLYFVRATNSAGATP